jgi:hypothetical protein
VLGVLVERQVVMPRVLDEDLLKAVADRQPVAGENVALGILAEGVVTLPLVAATAFWSACPDAKVAVRADVGLENEVADGIVGEGLQ